jgi:uncharacterized SAM-binding protein YcdF (DUF218 family)
MLRRLWWFLWRLFLVICIVGGALYAARGSQILVVDEPQKSDVILVLAGETERRVDRGVEMLRQGYAPRLLIDVEAGGSVYGFSKAEIARRFIATLPPDEASRADVCQTDARSTKEEAHAAEPCLRQTHAGKVLIVTSDFHTRRAITIFRHELPQLQFSAAAARDAATFGSPWWRHREWAKQFLDETLKLGWFEVVDRWR